MIAVIYLKIYTCIIITLLVLVTGCTTLKTDLISPIIGNLKYIPAGSFQRDVDPTNISKVSAFYMSETEITREQYVSVTGLTDPGNTTYSTGKNDPVQKTSWYDALVFCNKLSLRENLTPVYAVNGATDPATWGSAPLDETNTVWDRVTVDMSASGYRLPTEMEWMWAAMGAKKGATGYRKSFAGSKNGTSADDYVWNYNNSKRKTHPVRSKKPNELGIYDMSGNVSEWCGDRYAAPPSGIVSDYTGPLSGNDRVIHGGNWDSDVSLAMITHRIPGIPYYQYIVVGFRVVRR